ncbi:ABC transporter permease, partial [Streptomyces alfalfae]
MPDLTKTPATDEAHAVAIADADAKAVDTVEAAGKPRSLWGDAWRDLRRRPLFIVSALLIFV